jgi:hypothetical protein
MGEDRDFRDSRIAQRRVRRLNSKARLASMLYSGLQRYVTHCCRLMLHVESACACAAAPVVCVLAAMFAAELQPP